MGGTYWDWISTNHYSTPPCRVVLWGVPHRGLASGKRANVSRNRNPSSYDNNSKCCITPFYSSDPYMADGLSSERGQKVIVICRNRRRRNTRHGGTIFSNQFFGLILHDKRYIYTPYLFGNLEVCSGLKERNKEMLKGGNDD